jgi:YfiH family protein
MLIRSKKLGGVSGVAHGFGVRGVALGDLIRGLGLDGAASFCTNQVHGNRVHVLSAPTAAVLAGDAFITDRAGLVCSVRSADCVPILIADARGRAVGAVHAGWRGTAKDVAGEALSMMRQAYGTDPADCVAAIGPCICGGCYEVGPEVEDAMAGLGIGDLWRAGAGRVDLRRANARLLMRAGIPGPNIETLPDCTRCDARFASFRRDGGGDRQASLIALTS